MCFNTESDRVRNIVSAPTFLLFFCLLTSVINAQILTPPTAETPCRDGNGKSINWPKFYDYPTESFLFEDQPTIDCETNPRGCKGVCMDAATLYDNGNCIYRANLHSSTLNGLSCMEKWTSVFTKKKPIWESLWRTSDYQEHFQDIWVNYQKLKYIDVNKSPECADLKTIYKNEVTKHGLLTLGTKPAGRGGYHPQGKAIDMPKSSLPDKIILKLSHPITEKPANQTEHPTPPANAQADYTWSSEQHFRVEVDYTYHPGSDDDDDEPKRLCHAYFYESLCSTGSPCSAWWLEHYATWWDIDCSSISRDWIAGWCGMNRPLPQNDDKHYEPNGTR